MRLVASFRPFNSKTMDKNITIKIQEFLQTKNPTDAQIIEGATLLLQLSPARNRAVYNSTLRRPKSMLPWVRADLKKYLGIRKRGLEISDVEKYNKETVARIEESLSVVPEGVASSDASQVPIAGTRGRRQDHDQLPKDIQDIWDKNKDRWQMMRKYHAQLAIMIAKPDYAPCDGNELCYQLRNLDTDLRKDYDRYDNYKPGEKNPEPKSGVTDKMKTVQNARSAISRGLSRKKQTEETLKTIQDAVNTLVELKQVMKPVTIDKLKAIGIEVPVYA